LIWMERARENNFMARNIERKDLDGFSHETSSQRILLEEYRLLQSRFLDLQGEGVMRMNFFITAASVSIGSLLVFGGGNSNVSPLYFKLAMLTILVLLGIINFYICRFFVSREIAVDRYERGLARIRRYFIQLDHTIEDYFVTRVLDVPTSNIVGNNSGMRRAAQLIEAFLLGLAFTISATFSTFRLEIDFLIGLTTAVFVFLIFEVTAQRKFKKAEKNAEKEMKFKERVNAK